MANVKLTDIVKRYVDCETSGDFADWITRLELVAELQKTKDTLVSVLPLLLDGPAFAVYNQMPEETRKDYEQVKKGILTAFGVDCYVAYEQFQNRVLQEGESVDVFLSDLKRLVLLIGLKAEVAEPMIKCAFIAGLPVDVKTQLKSVAEVENLGLAAIATRARVILSTRDSGSVSCSAGARGRGRGACYACRKVGHIARNCPNRPLTDVTQAQWANSRGLRQCFACGQWGHIASQCGGSPNAGKGHGGTSAPDVASASH